MEIQKLAKKMWHRNTKMEDLRRTGSLRAKKGSHTILARARSEGMPYSEEAPLELPQRSYTPLPNLPPVRPRKFFLKFTYEQFRKKKLKK
jgi:hypothetical protein